MKMLTLNTRKLFSLIKLIRHQKKQFALIIILRKTSKEIDTTNKYLIDCLWSDYDIYTLINLHIQDQMLI